MYATCIERFVDPLDLRRSHDSTLLKYLREFNDTQWLDYEVIRELQWKRARAVIEHAYRTCPYYQRRFQGIGLVPSDINSFEDWGSLPVLEKSDVQAYRDEMVSNKYQSGELLRNQTGGSTGQPISFFLSRDRSWSRAAATRRHDAWAGYHIGDKRALIWGAVPDVPARSWKQWLRNALIDRNLYLDASCITAEKLESFDLDLKRFRPKIIQAYAKALVLFARYLANKGVSPYQPHAIITSAEVLSPGERTLVESVFGCRVFNRYGCREFSVIASECECHDGMHVMAEGLYVETSPPLAGCSSDNAAGSILVTDLLNLAMPMIRYRIGDMANRIDTPCACGRGLPKIGNIEGRVTDFLVGDDGRLISGVFLATYVIAQRPSLGQIQLLQDTPRHVVYRIRPPDNRGVDRADVAYLESATRRFLGTTMSMDVEVVDVLETGRSGKFLYCRSNVASDLIGK